MPNTLLLNPAYEPITTLARTRGTAFHLATRRYSAVLHLHLADGSTLEIGDDGVGGAAAQKPSGTTGFTILRTLPGGHRSPIYDSTMLGPDHANGANPAPLLAALDRLLPPAPTPRPRHKARQGLLRRLLRLT
ncbi:hypothetical protein [Kitasatospora cineracea]|uniref:hypothetical protein n=1 Tax=Kitasatospora cineracea TaxID=88074 RepID=UPI0033EFDDA5